MTEHETEDPIGLPPMPTSPSRSREPAGDSGGTELGILRGDGEALGRILELVATSRNAPDFSEYKRPTLERQVAKRMQARHIDDLSAYLDLLEADREELERLWHGWLIRVSGFFRDPEAFEVLFEKGLGPRIREKSGDESLRIWVAGCATGEEAYSIGIGVTELLEREQKDLSVRIFASDLSPAAVSSARQGSYSAPIAAAVGPERLERFFSKEPAGYRVAASLRRRIVFGTHDLLSDPFFHHLDLISCRNLLIYWTAAAQQRVLAGFHESLDSRGLLWLGPTETVGRSASLFRPLDKKWRLFERV